MLIVLNSESFDKIVPESEIPVLVDFFAQWCGPCKMLEPIVEQLSHEFGEKILICKVDIDESASIAQRYEIMSVPTLIFFERGKIIHTERGFSTHERLCNIIKTTFSL
jgi:thioredoxin 1